MERPLWTIRSVNGKKLPKLPATLTHTFITVDRDPKRNLNADLIRNIVNKKNKFEITFPYLTEYWLNRINEIFKDDVLWVEYEDYFNPNVIRRGKFYHGDLVKEPYMYKQKRNDSIYKPYKVSLIEH